jgi:hypothetical protein
MKQSIVGITIQGEKAEKVEEIVEACIDPSLYPLICPNPQYLFYVGDEGLLRKDRDSSLQRHVQKFLYGGSIRTMH